MQFASVYITPSRSSQYAESRHLNCYRRLYRRATKADTHLSPGQPSAAVVAQSPRTRRDPRRLPAPGRPHRGRWRSCPAETALCFGNIFDGATIGIWVALSDGLTGTPRPGLIARRWWYNGRGSAQVGRRTDSTMDQWRSRTGKQAERVRQVSLEAYRKALKSIRTRTPEWRPRLPSGREGWMRVGLLALAVLVALVVSGSGVVAGMALAFNRKLPDVSALYAPPDEATRVYGVNNELIASLYRENRASVPLEGIPLTLRQAVIAIEDYRF